MSKVNLRAAFAAAVDPQLSAQQVFANRVSELEAFESSLVGLRDTLVAADVSPVTDRAAPRRNVLVYYGVGGIGKTTLSQELERRYLAQTTRRERRAAVRFDLSELTTFDIESYLIQLRAALGHLKARWPAFDLALKVYWDRAHPGDSLEEFLDRGSAVRRAARATGLSQQISSSIARLVGDAMPGGVTGIAYNLSSAAFSLVKDKVANNRVLRQCDLLPVLLDADADIETLSYLPYLLAWELDRLPVAQRSVTVFFDTYENLIARGGRETERLLQRSVYLMPNVLFVISGRHRLDWGDLKDAGELDFVGADRWPNLAAAHANDEPRQHLVGYLSTVDARGYLAGAVSKRGRPAITGAIRDRIVSASAGLPLYLDLAVNTYLEIASKGRKPTAANFGQPLPAVTARMLRDLDRDERELLRAAALLDRFNLALLHAGCPQVPDAAVARFKNRLFLEYDPDRAWQYSLHDVLRDAILEADVGLADSWSARERARVAGRIAAHLGEVFRSGRSTNDRALKAAAFQQAVDLGVATRQFFTWLVDAAQDLVTSGIWNFVAVATTDTGAMSAFLWGLTGVRERRSGQLSKAISALNTALGQDGLPDGLRRFLTLHRGHALRVAGHYAEGAEDFAALVHGTDGYVEDAVYWLADYSFLDGRFDEALAALDTLTGSTSQLRGEVMRLRGHVHRVNGLFDAAEGYYRAALALGRETANLAAVGKALTDLVQTLSWRRPNDVGDLHTEGVEVNARLRNHVELVKLNAAFAVTAANLSDVDTAKNEIRSGIRLAEECGYRGGLIWCWVAAAFSELRHGSRDSYADAVEHVSAVTEQVGGNRFWADITRWWGAREADRTDSSAQWIGGTASARQRWRSVLDDGSTHA